MNTIIPFSSRSEAVRLSRALSRKHVAHTLINTPRRLGVSCGLSIVIYDEGVEVVTNTIKELGLTSGQGIFRR